jgi:exosortase D (VPLPA-CTERM-specific)
MLAGAACVAGGVAFADAMADMWHTWMFREEYSHGPLLPALVAYLVWRRRDAVAAAVAPGSWLGVVLVVAGIALLAVGRLTTIYVLQQYAALVVLAGLVVAFAGAGALRLLWAPFVVLALMIPPPYIVLNNLSSGLQLISSELGTALLRLAGVSVFLQGNVIDLGAVKLQVAEACSGLNYLFPLLTLAFVVSILFSTAVWQRVALMVSSVPITIAMNSLRIAFTGVTVDRWGASMAEGRLHDFEGWLVFMLSAALLYAELRLLGRLTRAAREPATATSAPAAPARAAALPAAPPAAVVAVAVLLAAALAGTPGDSRQVIPGRERFDRFPVQLGDWQGRRAALEKVYLDTLKLDDYLLADFRRGAAAPVNLYLAWYDAQSSGVATHSPRSCLPGGGWQIVAMRELALPGIPGSATPLRVNRLLIESGDQRQLVYYWFQQRGRVVTSEYLAKWYLFWDALTLHRTDGALVRVTVPIASGQDVAAGDAALTGFLAVAVPRLAPFIPGR